MVGIADSLYDFVEKIPESSEEDLVRQLTFGFYIQLWRNFEVHLLVAEDDFHRQFEEQMLRSEAPKESKAAQIWLGIIKSDLEVEKFMKDCVRINLIYTENTYEKSKQALKIFS